MTKRRTSATRSTEVTYEALRCEQSGETRPWTQIARLARQTISGALLFACSPTSSKSFATDRSFVRMLSGQPPNYLYFARMKSMLSPMPYPNFSLIPRTRSSLATKASRRLAGNLSATTRACSNMRTSAAK